jgi:outer membrane immunogenic protein
MQKVLLAACAASLLGIGASAAADLPTMKSAPLMPAPAAVSWTGCYVGAVGGIASGHSDMHFASDGSLAASNSPSSGEIGATVGCDWQTSSFVFGALADLAWSDLNASSADIANTSYTLGVKSDWSNTDRLRVGYAWGPALLYATGGLSVRDVGAYESATGTPQETIWKTRTGWNIGAGVEFLVLPHVSLKGEYLYEDFGNSLYTWSTAGFSPKHVNLNDNLFRVGLNYHF